MALTTTMGTVSVSIDIDGDWGLRQTLIEGDAHLRGNAHLLGDFDRVLAGSPTPLQIRNSINDFFVNFDQFLRQLVRAISFN
jgi:hypothetical protein